MDGSMRARIGLGESAGLFRFKVTREWEELR